MNESYNDLSTYAEMVKPFQTQELATEAISKFFDAVAAARKEYRIADVHIQVLVGAENGVLHHELHLGNSANAIVMLSAALKHHLSEATDGINPPAAKKRVKK